MLIKQPQIKLVERKTTTKDGREVIVLAAFTISEGQIISARIVGVKPSETIIKNEVKTLAPAYKKESAPVSRRSICSSIATPFFDLVFLMSQPTRAPARGI